MDLEEVLEKTKKFWLSQEKDLETFIRAEGKEVAEPMKGNWEKPSAEIKGKDSKETGFIQGIDG